MIYTKSLARSHIVLGVHTKNPKIYMYCAQLEEDMFYSFAVFAKLKRNLPHTVGTPFYGDSQRILTKIETPSE